MIKRLIAFLLICYVAFTQVAQAYSPYQSQRNHNLTILAATSSSTSSSYNHTSEKGLMSNGGLSISYGSRESNRGQTTVY